MSNYTTTSKILSYLKTPLKYSILVFALLILSRIGFIAALLFKNFIVSDSIYTLLIQGINYDYLFVSSFFILTVLLFLLLQFMHPKLAGRTIFGLGLTAISLNSLLYGYVIVNTDLLGSQILSYSIQEIYYIASASFGDSNVSLIVLPLLLLNLGLYVLGSLKWEVENVKKYNVLWVPVILFVIGATQYKYANPNQKLFDSALEFKYSHNPISYLTGSIITLINNKEELNEKEIEWATTYYQSKQSHLTFTDPKLPFLRENKKKEVLDSLFNLKETPPNIVVLIVESLSRSFSGRNSRFKGFTPFLDSLSKQSLSWEYFYSNCSRTYGVIPNLFCSAPNGLGRGFMSSPNFIPQHLSLIKLLNNEDYESNFFYGGWGNFDNTEDFLIKQGLQTIFSKKDFDKKYENLQSKWGYKDEALFLQYFDAVSANQNSKPRLDILLTLSIHTPFDQAPEKFTTIVDSLAQFNIDKKIILANKNVFKTVLYTDDCIKKFISDYKKRDDYENTIFIITGDHNVQALPLTDELDRFHVPFIIYSPMLKSKMNSTAVGSHLDLSPTIWDLLSNKYDFYKPPTVPWVGAGLKLVKDANPYFVPLSNLPNMGNGLTNESMIIDGQTFSVEKGRVKEEIDNTQLKQLMKSYRTLNEYVCTQNKLSK